MAPKAVAPPRSRPIKDKVAECVCSACVLSVCCPISLVWCCLKLPCEIGWSLAQNAKKGSCCGSNRRRISYASYSSFSDMDSDDVLAKRDDDSCGKAIVSPSGKKRWLQRTRCQP